MQAEENQKIKGGGRSRGLRTLCVLAAVLIVMAVLSIWWVRHNLYASPFSPTELSQSEQQVLDVKLDRLEQASPGVDRTGTDRRGRLEPEPYREDDAKRTIVLSEKELNSLIAQDEAAARRVALDLSQGMVSVKLLIPVDRDFPVLGGKTLRLSCGIHLGYEAGKPVVAVRGVNMGGVPIPNAWLGNIKNVDLVREFGGQGGFWDLFSEGVEDLRISEGSLTIRLKE